MSKNLVSVIIPSYNGAKYIIEAIDSALSQTYKNIEVIVVDDGSTDNTKEFLEPYIKENKIKYFYQENKGLAGTRNTGMKAAQGEYIAFLDSDDLFLPSKIEKQVKFLEDNLECGVCYCDIYHFYDDAPEKMIKLDYIYYSGAEVFKKLLEKNFINPLTVVLRRSVIEKVGYFNENFRRTEDWEYWVRLGYKGTGFCFLKEILAKYRMRKDSLSYNWQSEIQRKELQLKIFEDLITEMPEEEKKRYKMNKIILFHKSKLLYAKLSSRITLLKKIQLWFQKKRLKLFF